MSSGCAASTNCSVIDFTGALFGTLWGDGFSTGEANHSGNMSTMSQIGSWGFSAIPQFSVNSTPESTVQVVGKEVNTFEGIANPEKWQEFERAAAQRLRSAGYRVATQVRITWAGAKGAYAVLDAVGVNGKNIVVLEAKDGFFSKLSPAQKAIIREMISGGEIMLTVESQADALSLKANEALAKQGVLYVSVETEVGSRAGKSFAATAARNFAKKGAQRGFVSFELLSTAGELLSDGVGAIFLWAESEELAPATVPQHARQTGYCNCVPLTGSGK